MLYEHEFSHGLNPLPDALERQRQAAERAVEVDPMCQHGWLALASAHFFGRDLAGLRVATERAISINPLNTETLALSAIFLVSAGDSERAVELVRQASGLNPNHPGWYHFVLFNHHYRRREYEEALLCAKRVNMPLFPWTHLSIAAAAGQLNRATDAVMALDALARNNPRFLDLEKAREEWARWNWDEELLDRFIDGVKKAKAISSTAGRPASDVHRPASIAVLPFTDLSATKDQEWFCDGIAEEILNALSPLPGLHVAARTSAFSFRGKNEDLRSIGEKLNVATVLEGSVRRSGDRVRITAQLIDASNRFHLWSERYDREVNDIFDVQDEIAKAVAERLRVTLVGGQHARLVEKSTTNIEAYELYLKGRALLYQRGSSIMPALEQFRKAVELDPNYALAWAGIADAYTVIAYFGLLRGAEAKRHGLAAAKRSIELDPSSPEGHTALACAMLLYENNLDGAQREFRRALELNPNYIRGRCWYALICLQFARGRFEEGLAEVRRAAEADPLSAYVTTILAASLGAAGRHEEASDAARRAVQLDPSSFLARWVLGAALSWGSQYDEAVTVLEQAAAMSARHHFALTSLALVHGLAGRLREAAAIHQELVDRATRAYVPCTQLTLTADAMGDRAAALVFARRAMDDWEPPFVLLARHFPDFRPLHEDPRFVAIVSELDRSPVP